MEGKICNRPALSVLSRTVAKSDTIDHETKTNRKVEQAGKRVGIRTSELRRMHERKPKPRVETSHRIPCMYQARHSRGNGMR